MLARRRRTAQHLTAFAIAAALIFGTWLATFLSTPTVWSAP